MAESADLPLPSLVKGLALVIMFSVPGVILAHAGLPNPLFCRAFSGLNNQGYPVGSNRI